MSFVISLPGGSDGFVPTNFADLFSVNLSFLEIVVKAGYEIDPFYIYIKLRILTTRRIFVRINVKSDKI
jgi:hypothetical protein